MLLMDIITKEMQSLQGVNKMTEKFILGMDLFEERGIKLNKLVTSDGISNVSDYKSHIGDYLNQNSYSKKRQVIEMIKKIPAYRSLPAQKYLCERGWKSESDYFNFLHKECEGDVLFFQTVGTAYYYLKKFPHSIKKKILISHADTDPLEQLLLSRPEIKDSQYERILRQRYEFVYRSMDTVITICKSSQEYMFKSYGINCPFIINGIEDYLFWENQEKLSLKDGKIHLVSVGSLIKRKGFDVTVDAVAKIQDRIREKCIFHFAGTGKDFYEIKEKIAKNKIEDLIILHGPVIDVGAFLAKMDAFIFPTKSDTVPVSIIESLRAGVPVFSTNVGEIAFMLSNGAGEIIQSSVDSVSNSIISIIEGKYDLLDMSRKSRENYDKYFSLKKMCNSYSDVIQGLYL